jgi:hypothetical protein
VGPSNRSIGDQMSRAVTTLRRSFDSIRGEYILHSFKIIQVLKSSRHADDVAGAFPRRSRQLLLLQGSPSSFATTTRDERWQTSTKT